MLFKIKQYKEVTVTTETRILSEREGLKAIEKSKKADDKWYVAKQTIKDEEDFYSEVHKLLNAHNDVDPKLLRIAKVKHNRAICSPSDWKPDQIQL